MAIQRAAVLGGGSFGTVIANLMARNGLKVTLWMRNQDAVNDIASNRTNSHYLPDLVLHENLTATTSLGQSVEQADLVFVAVPSASCRQVARDFAAHIKAGVGVVSTTKGIEETSFLLMSQVLQEELTEAKVGVLSGPNLAKEIADEQFAGTVIASPYPELNLDVHNAMSTGHFKVYSGNDTFGVELGGALKNIYAIVCGMAKALQTGENTFGLLLTRGLAEMSRFAVHLGANPLTFIGLAGVGDLVVTCNSPLSRNFRVGFALGEGKDLDQVVAELGQVAEGVRTLKIVKHKADEEGIYMPMVSALYQVIYENASIDQVVGEMMSGEQNQDVEFVWAPNA